MLGSLSQPHQNKSEKNNSKSALATIQVFHFHHKYRRGEEIGHSELLPLYIHTIMSALIGFTSKVSPGTKKKKKPWRLLLLSVKFCQCVQPSIFTWSQVSETITIIFRHHFIRLIMNDKSWLIICHEIHHRGGPAVGTFCLSINEKGDPKKPTERLLLVLPQINVLN